MEKEKGVSTSLLWRELFQFGIYKRNQGRIARQVTFGVLALGFALAAWRLSSYLINHDYTIRFAIPGLVLLAGLWLSFRLVNLPSFADFLIAVEAEMNKVSWPTRGELFRSSLVVIFCIVFLAAILYGYDLFWRTLLQLLRIVDTS